ncbi:hypothetical protein WJX72_008279 [[Myrmecia] bisecta]|uniref:DUF952 domain-containing protein n=1 Tax=[Myrmecia] bisecta TaxID=41462 RepID=A0AAW1Q0Q2_9CHLO
MTDHGLLYHLVPHGTWETHKSSKTAYFPPTYEQDGYIHLTKEPAFLLQVANHFYTDVPGPWVVLCIDSSKLTSEVKFEPASVVGNKAPPADGYGQAGQTEAAVLFPHLYGTIDFGSVQSELPVVRDDDGKFVSITGLS